MNDEDRKRVAEASKRADARRAQKLADYQARKSRAARTAPKLKAPQTAEESKLRNRQRADDGEPLAEEHGNIDLGASAGSDSRDRDDKGRFK